jgi:hypothetical protein
LKSGNRVQETELRGRSALRRERCVLDCSGIWDEEEQEERQGERGGEEEENEK